MPPFIIAWSRVTPGAAITVVMLDLLIVPVVKLYVPAFKQIVEPATALLKALETLAPELKVEVQVTAALLWYRR
jgi:hypothetical protein